MEIIGSDLAKICKVTPQNIYFLVAKGKLVKTESNKYNIYDPLNSAYLKQHNQSVVSVREYLDAKNVSNKSPKKRKIKTAHPQKPIHESKNESKPETNETLLLVEILDEIITNNYSKDEAIKIKNQLFSELERRLK